MAATATTVGTKSAMIVFDICIAKLKITLVIFTSKMKMILLMFIVSNASKHIQ